MWHNETERHFELRDGEKGMRVDQKGAYEIISREEAARRSRRTAILIVVALTIFGGLWLLLGA